MADIKKLRSVIDEASKEKEDGLASELNKIPCDSIFEDDNGMTFMFMYMDKENLDEGLKDNLSSLFKGAKNLVGDLKSGTEDAYKKAMRKVTTRNNASMSRQMKKQVKELTKKLKDKMYFDYNLVLQKYEKKNKVYSKEFFYDFISSMSMSPDAHKEVLEEFKPKINRMYNSVLKMYKEYAANNPDAVKDQKPKTGQAFSLLPKQLKKKTADDFNYLVGSIVGFAAAVSIADYFKNNPAKFKESNEINILESDINNILFNSQVSSLAESLQEYQDSSIMESLERNRDDDDGFDWNDDIEEEHDSIFKQYIEGRK